MSSSSNTRTPDSHVMDQDNPFHLQSSDSPGMKLVSEPFDGSGFSNWKRSMIIALSARNKLGFVNGSIMRPDSLHPTFKSWSRCNDMVISWILGALSKTIGRSVIYSNSANMMWKELEERYGTSNGTQLFSLQKQLTDLSQGNCNIADYFTKLKMLWDDMDSLCLIPICTCGCACGASAQLSKLQQEQRVIQFLMGRNDTYATIQGSILMSSQLPSICHVYSILLQDEAQRDIHSGTHFNTESASLNAYVSKSSTPASTSYSKKSSYDAKKSTLICNYCKKTGHLIDKCYKLHG